MDAKKIADPSAKCLRTPTRKDVDVLKNGPFTEVLPTNFLV